MAVDLAADGSERSICGMNNSHRCNSNDNNNAQNMILLPWENGRKLVMLMFRTAGSLWFGLSINTLTTPAHMKMTRV